MAGLFNDSCFAVHSIVLSVCGFLGVAAALYHQPVR